MQKINSIQEFGQETIFKEIEALTKMASFVDSRFEKAVEVMFRSKGRIIVSGIGKSAIIAQKMVATLNSTGTPAIFMHAADAIHGDLGMIQKEDVAVIISKSGESPEIKALLPFIKNFGNPTIALCGNKKSFLAIHSDIYIDTTVDEEAEPNNLAPTTSTTAQLVMGDALAVCLLKMRGFTSKDFAKFHPGGALGKRLYLKVGDLSRRNSRPEVDVKADLKKVILEISANRLGATAVMDGGKLIGIITDGDLRRMLAKENRFDHLTADIICSKNPKSIEEEVLAVHALEIMRQNSITQLLVTKNGIYSGMVHLHDLIREGLL